MMMNSLIKETLASSWHRASLSRYSASSSRQSALSLRQSALSSRRRPGSRKAALLDSGLRRNDGGGVWNNGAGWNNAARWVLSFSKGLSLLLLLILLSACGFHPRGETARPAAAISPVYITGLPQHNPFVRELRHQLQLGGVSLTEARDQAATIIELGQMDHKRSVFSVNANNKVVEYEIERGLRFSVERPPGNRVLKNQELSTRYIVYDPGGQLLGRTREAELRTRDAYRELVQRLLNRLSKIQ